MKDSLRITISVLTIFTIIELVFINQHVLWWLFDAIAIISCILGYFFFKIEPNNRSKHWQSAIVRTSTVLVLLNIVAIILIGISITLYPYLDNRTPTSFIVGYNCGLFGWILGKYRQDESVKKPLNGRGDDARLERLNDPPWKQMKLDG